MTPEELAGFRHDLLRFARLQLRDDAAAEDAVQQCYSVTGEADYLLVVNVASMADYEALTRRLFEGDDNIKRFRTSVALASLKTGLRVPLDSAAPAA